MGSVAIVILPEGERMRQLPENADDLGCRIGNHRNPHSDRIRLAANRETRSPIFRIRGWLGFCAARIQWRHVQAQTAAISDRCRKESWVASESDLASKLHGSAFPLPQINSQEGKTIQWHGA